MSCKHLTIEPVGSHLKCFDCGTYQDGFAAEPLDPNDYRDSLMDEYLEREANAD